MSNTGTLYLRHRPTEFKDVVGNRPAIEALEAAFTRKEGPPHAMLFVGPSGCGKTTMARIAAAKLGCSPMDFQEVDSADFRGIDTIRDIRQKMAFRPMGGPVRVWLLDECHKMSGDAQAALLKALEDTPAHVYLLLATTDPDKLIPTVRNRCAIYTVSALPEVRLVWLMETILKKEGKTVAKPILEQIARDALGSSRAALVILDKVMDLPPDKQARAAEQQAAEENEAIALVRTLINASGSGSGQWHTLAPILKALKTKDADPENIRRVALGYCTTILLNNDNPRAYLIMDSFRRPTYDMGWPAVVLACYEVAFAAGR
jgi:DNA polymerase-3 subunit gamma/tau